MAKNIQAFFHSKALQNVPNMDFWYENIPSGNPGAGQALIF
jgi:hypothetical protein